MNQQYIVNKDDLPAIKKMFWGYIFRRVEDGVGYIKCSEKQMRRIMSAGIPIWMKLTIDER